MSDIQSLVPLFGQLGYPTTEEALTARFERNLASDYKAWVHESEEKIPIGFAGGHIVRPFEHDFLAAQLMILIVDDQHRGYGAGIALVDAFEDWAKREGAQRVMVNSGTAREETHRFYKARGYEASGYRFGKKL